MKRHDVLLAKLGFGSDDLAANREGLLTTKQRIGLEKQRSLYHRMRISIILIAIGGEILLYSLVNTPGDAKNCSGLIIALLAGMIYIITNTQYRNYVADLAENKVEFVAGKLHKPRGELNRTHILQIEDRYFNVNLKRYRRFEVGALYRIYYTPYSKTILSVEYVNP